MIEMMIAIGLASYRLANLLVNENGPFAIFDRIRTKVGANEIGFVDGFLPELFSCIYCMSIWTTLCSYLLWRLEPVGVIILASSSIVILANSVVNFAKEG